MFREVLDSLSHWIRRSWPLCFMLSMVGGFIGAPIGALLGSRFLYTFFHEAWMGSYGAGLCLLPLGFALGLPLGPIIAFLFIYVTKQNSEEKGGILLCSVGGFISSLLIAFLVVTLGFLLDI